jgi:hypothetical protein
MSFRTEVQRLVEEYDYLSVSERKQALRAIASDLNDTEETRNADGGGELTVATDSENASRRID